MKITTEYYKDGYVKNNIVLSSEKEEKFKQQEGTKQTYFIGIIIVLITIIICATILFYK